MPRKPSVLVIGQGSIGVRHSEVLADIGCAVRTVSRRPEKGYFASISEALSSTAFDTIAVATETSRHASDLAELDRLNYSGSILVEKPVCAWPDELEAVSARHNISVGYNLRFMPVVAALRKALAEDCSPVISAQFNVGQSLATWRAQRKPDESYSAYREQGGGVLRDLSHELDLAVWLFGSVERVTAIGGRYGNQTVDSDDAWSILAVCAKSPQVAIALNGINTTARRSIAVTTLDQTYLADLVDGTLRVGLSLCSIPSERNNSYTRMWQAVLSDEGARADLCTFDEGMAIVRLIAAIEVANEQRCWIELEKPS